MKDNKMSKVYTVPVIEIDENDLGIELPDELMKDMGWEAGDTIVWTENGDSSWTLTVKRGENGTT
jgi:hypothetical protein